ncbi:hypothetical protein [Herbaspirillum sp. VT-16-41]|uniref:hypothetical protein n=1 Tax=Herbaspirillum sp. VT-16-41 TaxID=1953765 RepID=UPI0011159F58|nr:hypothetical protein [Herbaspirillum sp. VT-16-41]
MTVFSAGPDLSSAPEGDPRRQAIASLRGYAYQLRVSALAWIGLKAGEELHLEVAEDYAIATEDALKGVQVKDTANSGTLTINNSDVTDALDAYVDLVERNTNRRVSFHFLTTASLGKERDLADRVNGQGVLEYWRQAAAGADVAPLRRALLSASSSDKVRQFIRTRTDEQLRGELLRQIHWDCQQEDLAGITEQLDASIIEFASERFGLSPTDCKGLTDRMLCEVLDAIVKPQSRRRLRTADLLKLCESHTQTSVPNALLVRFLSGQLPATANSNVLQPTSLLEPVENLPFPSLIVPRQSLITSALGLLRQHQFLVLAGGSGLGKTIAARMVASRYEGRWLIFDLRDMPAVEICRRIDTVIGQIVSRGFEGIIVDDLNELETPTVTLKMARLLLAIKRQDGACIVTCYRQPSKAVADRLGIDVLPSVPVENLSFEEVAELVLKAGGSERAAFLAYLYGGNGHPQLVRAFMAYAKSIGWAELESSQAVTNIENIQADLKSDQRQLRRSLIDRFDENTRTLLYRLSLLIGRFDRALALQIGGIDPAIRLAGESLDQLVGPWIDDVGAERLRISPLVERAGEEVLDSQEQQAIHCRAAEVLAGNEAIQAEKANAIYLHAKRGHADWVLLKIALAIIAEGMRKPSAIADWIPSLVGEPTDVLIYPRNPHTSRYLRFAQLLLLAERKSEEFQISTWRVLCEEIKKAPNDDERAVFEYLVLSKVLISNNLASVLPNPIGLLERHHELTSSNIQFQSVMAGAEEHQREESGAPVNVSSLFFVTQAMGVQTVEKQYALFVELGKLSKEAREKYFLEPNDTLDACHSIVNAAWLAELKAGTLDWQRAADTFLGLATLVEEWEKKEFALYFHVARSVMLDEYGNQTNQALKALELADSVCGANAITTRARARIYFRGKKFAESLSAFEQLSSDLSMYGPLEQFFIGRETAISASKIDDWAKCGAWFQMAIDASEKVASEDLEPMFLGVRADHALAMYKAGNFDAAIAEIDSVLSDMPQTEDESSLSAVYCRRVIPHGLLWMYSHVKSGHAVLVNDQPPVFEAGMCSNPEPPAAIREHPRPSKITSWHLWAAIKSYHSSAIEARAELDKRIGGQIYPSLEFVTRHRFLEDTIRKVDAVEFAQLIKSWLDVNALVHANQEEMKADSPISPKEGEIPSLQGIQLEDEWIEGNAIDAIQAFAVNAAMSGRSEALKTLHVALENIVLPKGARKVLELMISIDPDATGDTLQRYVAEEIQSVLRGKGQTPEQLFASTLRFVQVGARSSFKPAVESHLIRWAKHHWREMLQRRFAFKNPDVYLPAIGATLSLPGLNGIAAILLAAEPALKVNLSESFRIWLKSLR